MNSLPGNEAIMSMKSRENRPAQGRMRAQVKSGPGSATNAVIPGPDHYQGVAMGNDTRKCSIDGCDNGVRARGWCGTHYQRWGRTGQLERTAHYRTPEEAFAARTRWDGECLVWTAGTVDGYGTIRVDGKMIGAHRFAWIREHGDIDCEFQLDHKCHNRACCNLDHLRPVTNQENGAYRSGAQRNSTTGVRNVTARPNGKFQVSVKKGARKNYFGTFETLGEAAQAAIEARRGLFGEYAGNN